MKNITHIALKECMQSHYIKLYSMHYQENGKPKKWDLIKVHDSVAILLYHKQKDSFLIVKQFRPAVYLKNKEEHQDHQESGYTYELCAGITDKNKSLFQIAQEEILEECGYAVPLQNIQKITQFYSSVGFASSKQTLFFAEICDEFYQHQGGGIDDECIEVIFIPLAEAKDFLFNEELPKTSGVLFAFLWFFHHYQR